MAEHEVPGFNFRKLDGLARELVQGWQTSKAWFPETHEAPDEPPRAVARQAEERVLRDPRTGKVYRSRDAAFADPLKSNAIRTNGGIVSRSGPRRKR